MKQSQYTVLAVSLATVFSTVAYADNERIAGRVPLSEDNHAQMAAENVKKINTEMLSVSLNVPDDLHIQQSYDLKNNTVPLNSVSGSLNADIWQIDDSYTLQNDHFSGSLKNVFQQDKQGVLLAENTITDTATDAPPARQVLSGSLNGNNANGKEIATPASQTRNDSNISGSLNEDNTPLKETANTANATELESITVIGQRDEKPIERYHNKITRNQIEHSATGNGDIGSMLRSLPNVQFDNAQRSSLTPGEIDPAKISISGGQHYQNLFLIDGMSFNNDLDPDGSGSWFNKAPGRSQGMAIDVNLLESIKVQDSNVSAEYGGFNGGVVETQTP